MARRTNSVARAGCVRDSIGVVVPRREDDEHSFARGLEELPLPHVHQPGRLLAGQAVIGEQSQKSLARGGSGDRRNRGKASHVVERGQKLRDRLPIGDLDVDCLHPRPRLRAVLNEERGAIDSLVPVDLSPVAGVDSWDRGSREVEELVRQQAHPDRRTQPRGPIIIEEALALALAAEPARKGPCGAAPTSHSDCPA